MVKYNEQGEILYIGRIDNQIKLRGYRIELDEIEEQLSKLDGVKESAVIFKDDMIIAYITGECNNPKEKLAKRLPEYMIPSIIERLEYMPLTQNGKIDKKALSNRKVVLKQSQFVAPRDSVEERLAEIFKEVLKVEKVGIKDSFFELGGNSILSIQLVNLAKRANISIEVKDIFVADTIEKLSALLENRVEDRRVLPQEEAILEEQIKPLCSPILLNNTILLTGATGFLGSYILSELLKEPNNTIYCLIRASSPTEAKERVQKVMSEYNLLSNSFDRVKFVVGDLAKPQLGIDKEIYEKLSTKITHIYHSASYMNSMVSYEVLRDVNVGGIKEIHRRYHFW